MNILDLRQRPFHRRGKIVVNVVNVRNDAHLITITAVPKKSGITIKKNDQEKRTVREKGSHLLVIHRSIDGTFRNLEAVNVNDWEDSARLSGVNVLESVPRCGSGAGLGFTVTDDAGYDEVGLIYDCSEGDTERVSQLSTFMDSTRSFGIDVTRKVSVRG